MLVWLASYPRSGNTFLRVLLHRLYGVATTTGYDDDDPVAQRVGPALVGYEPRTRSLGEIADRPELVFAKTHRRPDRVACGDRPAIYLVRDGRDAVVSFAHLRADDLRARGQDADLHRLMRSLVLEGSAGTGSWGRNVLAWLDRSPPPAVVRFERLIREPEADGARALAALGLDLPRRAGGAEPTFAELHGVDASFFRRGAVGSHRDEMPREIEEAFWTQPHHAEAMRRLGYGPP